MRALFPLCRSNGRAGLRPTLPRRQFLSLNAGYVPDHAQSLLTAISPDSGRFSRNLGKDNGGKVMKKSAFA
jgi:hypothetical protein